MDSTRAANGLASASTCSRHGPTRAMSAASFASDAARCRSASCRSNGSVTETDRVGFEPTKRLPVYTLSRRVPSAARPPIQQASWGCNLMASSSADKLAPAEQVIVVVPFADPPDRRDLRRGQLIADQLGGRFAEVHERD